MRSNLFNIATLAPSVEHYSNGELQSLATALCIELNLINDSSLAHVVGAGDEASAKKAVCTWVRWQLPELQGLAKPQLLGLLKERLYRHLTLWELDR